jgi:3-phosphoshikimate 1-carboxyvinyltransferase
MINITPLSQPIHETITISGSKSDTNRALVLASLTDGITTLTGISHSDDSRILIENLKKLSVKIETMDNATVKIYGNSGKFKEFNGVLNSGIAGTTSRFLAAICSLVPGKFILSAEGIMLERPMNELFEALEILGCTVNYLGKTGCLPVQFCNSTPIQGGIIQLNGSVSSQFFSALMLISPVFSAGLTIHVKNEQVSKSYIDMTQSILKDFGIILHNDNYKKYTLPPHQKLQSLEYNIQGDASGCSYFWGIAAVTQSTIRICNIDPSSVQGDIQFVDMLENMGCQVTKCYTDKWIEVTGTKRLNGIKVDMENLPDTAQTLAVISSFATGKTIITGLSTLKKKETDRLLALHIELGKMGITTEIGNDWIVIYGGVPIGAYIDTYHDHRMAMSFAIAGCKVKEVAIQHPEVVSKSFPHFWDQLNKIGIQLSYEK